MRHAATLGLGLLLAALGFAPALPRAEAQDGTGGAGDIGRKLLDEIERDRIRAHESDRKERLASGTRGAWGIAPDGSLVAAGTPAGAIEVWKAGEARPAFVLAGHGELVETLSFTPGGETLYSTGYEGTMRIWDLQKRELTSTLGEPVKDDPGARASSDSVPREFAKYSAALVSPDGRYVATRRGMLGVWDRTKRAWLEHTPAVLYPSIDFLPGSRHVALSASDGVEVHDLQAPPQKSRFDADKLRAADPVWKLRGKPKYGLSGFGPKPDKPERTELGDADLTWVSVSDAHKLLVTLSTTFTLGAKTQPKPVLRAWDATTGAKRWEKVLADENARLLDARASALIPVATRAGIDFHSPKDGAKVRTHAIAAKSPWPSILSPDATLGYAADKDGNLIRIPLTPPPPPAPPAPPAGPGAPPAPQPPK